MSKMIEELQEGISRLSAELTRLKELNREMVETMKQNCDICYKERDLDVCEECMFDKFINEAKEEEGE